MTNIATGRSLRILYTHFLDDESHPAVQMVHAIARELESLGHVVRVHRSYGPVAVQNPTAIPDAGNSPGWKTAVKNRLWFAKALSRNRSMCKHDRRAIVEFQPDIILAREDSYCVSIVLEARAARVPLVTYADVPVGYETRLFHSDVRWHPPFLVEQIERWWLKNSRAVVTPCHPAAVELSRYGLSTPIHVSANGVDPTRFPKLAPVIRDRARASLGLPSGKTIVGFQGSFRRFHGIDLLRDIMLATAARDDLHWLLIGDGPERAALQLATDGKCSATFLGKQPPERMGELTSLFDIAVCSHMFIDGPFYFCPLKILEYAAAGCGIIASSQGDIPKLLDGGRVGVLVDEPKSEAWIKALESLLDDHDRVAQLGASARAFVLNHLTWHNTASRVEAVLFETLGLKEYDGTGNRANDFASNLHDLLSVAGSLTTSDQLGEAV